MLKQVVSQKLNDHKEKPGALPRPSRVLCERAGPLDAFP
jgi:hypothetical protein